MSKKKKYQVEFEFTGYAAFDITAKNKREAEKLAQEELYETFDMEVLEIKNIDTDEIHGQ